MMYYFVLQKQADLIHNNSNITLTYVIGIKQNQEDGPLQQMNQELLYIANNEDHYFEVEDFDGLKEIKDKLKKLACKGIVLFTY